MMELEQLTLLPAEEIGEDPRFLSSQLMTYIGNKRALLPFIGKALEQVKNRIGAQKISILDMFSGTGVVARYCKQHASELFVNDLEPYSEATNQCYLSNSADIDIEALRDIHSTLAPSIAENLQPGFITELYAPKDEYNITPDDRVFYTRRNAMYLDTARQMLEEIPSSMGDLLLGPLLAEASVHANTSGVFKGFYKNNTGCGQFGGNGEDALARICGHIQLRLPVFSVYQCDVHIYREDANTLVKRLPEVDVAYFDPPYNQHPYGSNYFMLNLLVDYAPPTEISRVSGIPTEWKRSRYNQRKEAASALFDLIEQCPARFILISYNSEGFIPHEMFIEKLASLGRYEVCQTQYNTFRGCRNLHNRKLHVTEYLYLLEKE